MNAWRSLDELAAVIAGLASDPDTDHARLLEAFEESFQQPGGAADVVERYAGSENPVLARTLAFALARAASRQSFSTPSGPLVLRAIALRRTDDEWARVNLLTALQLSSMHDELLLADEPVPDFLVDFLLECVDQSEQVQSALVGGAIPELAASGILLRAQHPEKIRSLRSKLRALSPRPGSLLETELGELATFLDET